MAAGPVCLVEVRVAPHSSLPSLMIDGDLLRIRVPEAPVGVQATEAARRVLAAAVSYTHLTLPTNREV